MLGIAGCNTPWQPASLIDFTVDAQTWLNASPDIFETVDHYGVLVVDVLEKKKAFERLNISPTEAIEFPLEKARSYYILLIAYDHADQVLGYAEKELQI